MFHQLTRFSSKAPLTADRGKEVFTQEKTFFLPYLSHELMNVYIGGSGEEQLKSLLNELKESLRRSIQEQNDINIGKSLNGLGAIYLRDRNYTRSLSYSKAASIILAETSAKSNYALALFLSGVSYSQLAKQDSAVTCFNAVLALDDEINETDYKNLVALCLGQVYIRQKQYLFGLACYESVLDNLVNDSLCKPSSGLLTATASLIMQSCKAIYSKQRGIAAYHKLTSRYVSDSHYCQVTHLLQQLEQPDEPVSKNLSFEVQWLHYFEPIEHSSKTTE